MASSSVEHGAARTPPPPDQLASFYKLVAKRTIASVLCRHARNAELSANAAVQAEALFGDNSLVVAHLRMGESQALAILAQEANGAQQKTLFRRSWATLLSVLPLLLRRLEANTLLPGSIREEELEYEVHARVALKNAKNEPVPSPVQNGVDHGLRHTFESHVQKP